MLHFFVFPSIFVVSLDLVSFLPYHGTTFLFTTFFFLNARFFFFEVLRILTFNFFFSLNLLVCLDYHQVPLKYLFGTLGGLVFGFRISRFFFFVIFFFFLA